MKYNRGALIVLMLFVAALAWSTGAAEDGSAETEVTWWFGEWNEPRGTELAQMFESENPGMTVDVEPFAGASMQEKMLVAFRSGEVPHVLAVPNGWTIPFAQQGHLSQLDDYIGQSSFPRDDYFDSGFSTAEYGGDLYGVPYRIEAHAFIYNKDHYRDAGLDPESPPASWDELLEYSIQITDSLDGVYGYGITGGGEVGNTIFLLLPMIWANGGDVLSSDYSRAVVNEPAAVEAVRRYTEYYTNHEVSPPSTLENDGSAIRRLFEQGLVAQMQQGSYAIPNIQDAGIDVGTAMIPAPEGEDPAAILGGWNYTIPEGVSDMDLAWEYITFLTRADNMAYFTDTFPGRISAMEGEKFQDPLLQPFIDMLPYARSQPSVEQWPEITNLLFTEVQNVLLGVKDVQEAMDDAAELINDLL